MEFIRISDCLPAELTAALEWDAMRSELRARRDKVAGALGEGQEHRPTATRGVATGRSEFGKRTATEAAASSLGNVRELGLLKNPKHGSPSGTHTGTALPKSRRMHTAIARIRLVLVVDNG